MDCELRGGFPFTFPQAPEVAQWLLNASTTVVVDPVLLKPSSMHNVEYIYSRVHVSSTSSSSSACVVVVLVAVECVCIVLW